MRTILPAILAVGILLSGGAAPAAERVTLAVLPVKLEAKYVTESFHPGEFVQDLTIAGLRKVDRFQVLSVGDVGSILEEQHIQREDVKPENASAIAKALKSRLLLFLEITHISTKVETEDRVILKIQTIVCSASLGATLFDAQTQKSVEIGPFAEEDRKMAAEEEVKKFTSTSAIARQMLRTALDSASRKIRSRVYELYPLGAKISAVDGKAVTIDVGTKFGVKVGQKYVVYGMVERPNAVTGLKEKVREEVSLLVVDRAGEESSTCHVVEGEQNPAVGSPVERSLKE